MVSTFPLLEQFLFGLYVDRHDDGRRQEEQQIVTDGHQIGQCRNQANSA